MLLPEMIMLTCFPSSMRVRSMDIYSFVSIRNIPTVLFFKNGEIVDKQVGAVGKPVFVEKVKKLL